MTQRQTNWKNKTKDSFNNKDNNKRKFEKPRSDDYSQFKGRSVEVRYDDVNGALRRLKKVMERMDFQKEVSKREYFEKPSAQRKRLKDQAIKRTKKEVDLKIAKGEWMPSSNEADQSYLKGKRQRRKHWMMKEKVRRLQNRRG